MRTDLERSPIRTYLDFEKPIAELESKVAELRALEGEDRPVSIADEIKKLEQKARTALVDTYAKLTPWQKTQVARHPDRPHCLDFVNSLIQDFTPLAGDRYFAEDVTEPFVLEEGRLRVPNAPGIGVAVRADVIAAHTVRQELLRP